MAEDIQQLILDTLDSAGSINDSRSLLLPASSGPATSHDAQIIILGALNSLDSRDVSSPLLPFSTTLTSSHSVR